MKLRSVWYWASVSPGKPTMNVERIVTPGMRSRSFLISARISSCVSGRRMLRSTASCACCSGRSTYLQIFGSLAIVSMSSSLKYFG